MDELINSLHQELSYRLTGNITERAIREILQSIEDLGYKIVPANTEIDSTRLYEFSQTIARWCAKEGVESDDINAPQVLQSLLSDGWLILPPK